MRKYIVDGIFILLLFISIMVIADCCSTPRTTLDRCIETTREKSFAIWGSKTKVKDTAFLRECSRYHREQIIDKYSKNDEMKKIYKKKDGKYLRDIDGNLLYYLEPVKGRLTQKEKIYYIEIGRFIPQR